VEVLVIGGNRFIGRSLVLALLFRRHRVTVLNRGTLATPPGVEHVVADRGTDAFDAALAGRRFDAVVDFAAFTADDARRALGVVKTAHYLVISSGQVYLVTEAPRAAGENRVATPSSEEDYERPVLREPAHGTRDHAEWSYGVGKRRAESAALALRASHGVRAVVLRLPIIHGTGDPKLRLWAYLQRMLDGEPLLLPDAGRQLTRYLWVEDVGRAVVAILDHDHPDEAVFNLAQPDVVTLREFLERVSDAAVHAGARASTRFVDITVEELEREGLDRSVSPLSGHWSSLIDPARAAGEWGFIGTRLDQWLPDVVRDLIERPSQRSHAGYASRSLEIEIAKRVAPSPA
jgi:nucleoside-diphosphate-sugar epimerase